jgi:hypothetical protein
MIGDEGFIRIADGLEKNTSLKELCLYGGVPAFYSSFFLHSIVLECLLFDMNVE